MSQVLGTRPAGFLAEGPEVDGRRLDAEARQRGADPSMSRCTRGSGAPASGSRLMEAAEGVARERGASLMMLDASAANRALLLRATSRLSPPRRADDEAHRPGRLMNACRIAKSSDGPTATRLLSWWRKRGWQVDHRAPTEPGSSRLQRVPSGRIRRARVQLGRYHSRRATLHAHWRTYWPAISSSRTASRRCQSPQDGFTVICASLATATEMPCGEGTGPQQRGTLTYSLRAAVRGR